MSTETKPFATVEEALEDIAAGKMIVVVDDEDRENEGDLTIAAQFATPEAVNFMATHARGWICLALTPERCDELDLELMSLKNETAHQTPFTITRLHNGDMTQQRFIFKAAYNVPLPPEGFDVDAVAARIHK